MTCELILSQLEKQIFFHYFSHLFRWKVIRLCLYPIASSTRHIEMLTHVQILVCPWNWPLDKVSPKVINRTTILLHKFNDFIHVTITIKFHKKILSQEKNYLKKFKMMHWLRGSEAQNWVYMKGSRSQQIPYDEMEVPQSD